MKDRELECRIQQAFTHAVPDVLDSVLSDCDTQKGSVIPMTEKKRTEPNQKRHNQRWVKRFGGIAAACVLLVGCAVGFGAYRQNYTVDSVVSLDVNPSVEIQMNRKEKVLDVVALNEDGEQVIDGMDLSDSDLDVAVNALIGSMLQNGYLSELANSILISVDNDDAERSVALQEQLTQKVENLLQTNSFSGAVLSQAVTGDRTLQEQADQYGITPGKAQLIQQITEANNRYTFADLVPLSINELNLLRTSGGNESQSSAQMTSVGTASDKAYIGADKAKQVAFDRADITASKASQVTAELDYEDGVMVYQVEFRVGTYEYECDVNAATGAVVQYEKESHDDSHETTKSDANTASSSSAADAQSGGTSSSIGEDAAKKVALNHAGVSADKISGYTIELDTENGIQLYEIEFKAGGYEYDYDINAATGTVVRYDKEADKDHDDTDHDDHDEAEDHD